ncbi:DUF6089 family protein [Apibacter raozihei]|uniref:type IX secretion system protein PorG n=1 Tax=Apibacter raozihei TaxID=2500547 RepID=UPI000FE2BD41|nr:DUF6089 family protein [Apibacter raozihei]
MRKYFLLATFIITSCLMLLFAQKHEIGISIGKANIIGDIGKSNYIELFPMDMERLPISIGALYRLNLNNRQSLRFNLIYNRVFFDDYEASEDYRYTRGLAGDNTIIEASAVFEYYFFDINDIKRSGSSPYIFGGIAAYASNDLDFKINHDTYYNADGSPRTPVSPTDFQTIVDTKKSNRFDFSIPFGVGYKFKFNYNWLVSFEVGARYTLQDNLDYSAIETNKFEINTSPLLNEPAYESEIGKRNAEIIGRHQTGNTFKSNDWYLIWGFNITYTFGRPPCYCY